MNRFIWVRDRNGVEHFVNASQILRVTKVHAHGKYDETAYIVLKDSSQIWLHKDSFDTYQDVITKIQQVQS
jgi:hypothetical protein